MKYEELIDKIESGYCNEREKIQKEYDANTRVVKERRVKLLKKREEEYVQKMNGLHTKYGKSRVSVIHEKIILITTFNHYINSSSNLVYAISDEFDEDQQMILKPFFLDENNCVLNEYSKFNDLSPLKVYIKCMYSNEYLCYLPPSDLLPGRIGLWNDQNSIIKLSFNTYVEYKSEFEHCLFEYYKLDDGKIALKNVKSQFYISADPKIKGEIIKCASEIIGDNEKFTVLFNEEVDELKSGWNNKLKISKSFDLI